MKLLILLGFPFLATILFPIFYNIILAPFNIYANARKSKLGYVKPSITFYLLSFCFLILFIYLYIGILSPYFNFVLNNFSSKLTFYATCFIAYTIIPISLWKKVVKYQEANKTLKGNIKTQSDYDVVSDLIKLEKNQYVDLFALNQIMIALLMVIILIAVKPSVLATVWGVFKLISI